MRSFPLPLAALALVLIPMLFVGSAIGAKDMASLKFESSNLPMPASTGTSSPMGSGVQANLNFIAASAPEKGSTNPGVPAAQTQANLKKIGESAIPEEIRPIPIPTAEEAARVAKLFEDLLGVTREERDQYNLRQIEGGALPEGSLIVPPGPASIGPNLDAVISSGQGPSQGVKVESHGSYQTSTISDPKKLAEVNRIINS